MNPVRTIMTHEHLDIDVSGAINKGTIMATREELIKVFLTPRWLKPQNGEVCYEWRLRFPDGVIACIYGKQPHPQPHRTPQNWLIAGFCERAVPYVHEAFRIRLAQLRSA